MLDVFFDSCWEDFSWDQDSDVLWLSCARISTFAFLDLIRLDRPRIRTEILQLCVTCIELAVRHNSSVVSRSVLFTTNARSHLHNGRSEYQNAANDRALCMLNWKTFRLHWPKFSFACVDSSSFFLGFYDQISSSSFGVTLGCTC